MSDSKSIHRTSRGELMALASWAVVNKDEIQARVSNGATFTVFSKEKNVTPATIKALFTQAGIVLRPRKERVKKEPPPKEEIPPVVTAMLTVISRLCRDAKVSDAEIRPFMPFRLEPVPAPVKQQA